MSNTAAEERRKKANAELLGRARRGESTALIDAQATWWPPRPIIKKDSVAIFAIDGGAKGAPWAIPGPPS